MGHFIPAIAIYLQKVLSSYSCNAYSNLKPVQLKNNFWWHYFTISPISPPLHLDSLLIPKPPKYYFACSFCLRFFNSSPHTHLFIPNSNPTRFVHYWSLFYFISNVFNLQLPLPPHISLPYETVGTFNILVTYCFLRPLPFSHVHVTAFWYSYIPTLFSSQVPFSSFLPHCLHLPWIINAPKYLITITYSSL